MDKKTLIRFQKKIELDLLSGCWVWTASKNEHGYGKISYNGNPVRAHILSYQHWNGDIPKGLELDHKCRNRSCVNPDHLEPVTHKENMNRGIVGKNNQYVNATHCKNNHEFTIDNTYHRPTGGRACKICRNDAVKRLYWRKKIV